MNRHLRLVPELPAPTAKKTTKKKPAAAPPAAERPPAQFWRTTGFTRLGVPLSGVLGGKTAKAFESLKLRTVGDLMLHLPRRYVSGTELSDLRNLTEGDDVTVLAQVRHASVHGMSSQSSRGAGKFRLQAVITDGRGELNLTFFGAKHLVDYWQAQLRTGPGGSSPARWGRSGGSLSSPTPTSSSSTRMATSSAEPSATSTWARSPAPPGGSVSTRRRPSCGPGRSPAASPWPWTAWKGWRIRCRSGCGARPI